MNTRGFGGYMAQKLLILGAGIYGLVAKEVAESMGCFDAIAFADDSKESPYGLPVVGATSDLPTLMKGYSHAFVAIGNPSVRAALLQALSEIPDCETATLISPSAFVSPSAHLAEGVIVEPMALVHAACRLSRGCFVCAGAVMNHGSACGECSQIDCNSTVAGFATVPPYTKVPCGAIKEKE